MHRPERWGLVQFSTAQAGHAHFQPDPTMRGRDALMEIYYAQQAFDQQHGHWAQSLTALQLDRSVPAFHPQLTTTDDGFLASVEIPIGHNSQTWTIRQDSRIRRSSPDDDLSDKFEAILTRQAGAWNRGDIDAFMEDYWKSDQLAFSSGGHTTRGWQMTKDNYKRRYPTRERMGHLTFDGLEVTPPRRCRGPHARPLAPRPRPRARRREFLTHFSTNRWALGDRPRPYVTEKLIGGVPQDSQYLPARLRPIWIRSFAFVLGIVSLVFYYIVQWFGETRRPSEDESEPLGREQKKRLAGYFDKPASRMEAAGIEPASCDPLMSASTCVVRRLMSPETGSANKAWLKPATTKSRVGRSGVGRRQPEFATGLRTPQAGIPQSGLT